MFSFDLSHLSQNVTQLYKCNGIRHKKVERVKESITHDANENGDEMYAYIKGGWLENGSEVTSVTNYRNRMRQSNASQNGGIYPATTDTTAGGLEYGLDTPNEMHEVEGNWGWWVRTTETSCCTLVSLITYFHWFEYRRWCECVCVCLDNCASSVWLLFARVLLMFFLLDEGEGLWWFVLLFGILSTVLADWLESAFCEHVHNH